jgi:hypothetical protein
MRLIIHGLIHCVNDGGDDGDDRHVGDYHDGDDGRRGGYHVLHARDEGARDDDGRAGDAHGDVHHAQNPIHDQVRDRANVREVGLERVDLDWNASHVRLISLEKLAWINAKNIVPVKRTL